MNKWPKAFVWSINSIKSTSAKYQQIFTTKRQINFIKFPLFEKHNWKTIICDIFLRCVQRLLKILSISYGHDTSFMVMIMVLYCTQFVYLIYLYLVGDKKIFILIYANYRCVCLQMIVTKGSLRKEYTLLIISTHSAQLWNWGCLSIFSLKAFSFCNLYITWFFPETYLLQFS